MDFVDFVSEAAWCPAAEQAQLDAHAIANTGALMSGLDYEFSLSDFDQDIELDSHTSQSQLTSDLMPSIGSPPPTPAKTRISLACVPCRSRHARCDATVPACSQCRKTGRTCSYTTSRRRRGKASRVDPREKLLRDCEQIEIERSNQRNIWESRSDSHDTSSIDTSSSNFRSGGDSVVPAAVFQAVDRPSCSMPESDESSRFLDLYYVAFHAAHPFLLPHLFLNQRLQHNKSSLQSLLPVMHFVGSLFMPGAEKGALRTRAESALPLDKLPADGFIVQSLLIFGIALHSCNEFDNARKVLDQGIRIALQIGMQSKSFSAEHGEGCLVLEESWRRTWWFLYATDSAFAGIRHCSTFSLRDIQADVDLPCEEVVYESGDIPRPRTLEEYSMREFAGEDIVFSSFAYLIDLAHISGLVLALGTTFRDPFDPDVVSVDASLVNWGLYLPKEKYRVIEHPGMVDEIMFQALVSFNTLKVFLHRPLSQLGYSLIESTSKCAPPPSGKSAAERQRAYDLHTSKVLEAAEAGIGIFTLPGPFTTHTPLVICGLTLCLLAQISACRFKLKGPAYTAGRERVRLGLAAIKVLGEVWTIGANTVKEVQVIAREALSLQI